MFPLNVVGLTAFTCHKENDRNGLKIIADALYYVSVYVCSCLFVSSPTESTPLKAAPHRASHASCGLEGWEIFYSL